MIIDELIFPLDIYLEDNKNWLSLPDEWKNAYFINGNLWGIPSLILEIALTRYIREDWLNNLNIDSPESIEDFYEVMVKFTYNDPDEDGIDNTNGASDNICKPICINKK
jgi:putative aldouronate transport system substrate-binding protein